VLLYTDLAQCTYINVLLSHSYYNKHGMKRNDNRDASVLKKHLIIPGIELCLLLLLDYSQPTNTDMIINRLVLNQAKVKGDHFVF